VAALQPSSAQLHGRCLAGLPYNSLEPPDLAVASAHSIWQTNSLRRAGSRTLQCMSRCVRCCTSGVLDLGSVRFARVTAEPITLFVLSRAKLAGLDQYHACIFVENWSLGKSGLALIPFPMKTRNERQAKRQMIKFTGGALQAKLPAYIHHAGPSDEPPPVGIYKLDSTLYRLSERSPRST
jgi:hypothetical protein